VLTAFTIRAIALLIEAVRTSEMLVRIFSTARHNILEDKPSSNNKPIAILLIIFFSFFFSFSFVVYFTALSQ
jgi:hypothetical protein